MRLVATSVVPGKLLDFNSSVDYPTTGWVSGTSSPIQPGMMIEAGPSEGVETTSNVANWGPSELIFALHTGAGTVNPGRLVHIDKDFVISDVPNTGLTGRPVYVVLTAFAAGNVTRQGGWLLRAGIAPVQYAVAATTGAVYISATAGQATPTNPTGQKQIVNATCLIAAASTFTRSITAVSGSRIIRCTNTKGMYIGQAISTAGNTPIPTSTTISAIDPSGQFVTISNAAVASGTATATLTNTGFGICHLDRPFIQAAVN